ncbi:MAG: nickel pincer cofactor biosynthesis protein LarC [Candidatus Eremiobacteraeota bacterium]|nr:nickel pincer cofactor biosynthesis protein LarC [Candidatus Eremiobacteraeota bacterium]
MRIAYVDMIGGAAGDMLLAAFLDAGLGRDALERALRGVVAEGWTLAPQRVSKRGIAATYAGLVVPGEDGDDEHHHAGHDHDHFGRGTRTLADVLEIVERSALTPRQRERASAVYRRLADAEAHTHGTTADAIRFHEIGQIDAILDVAATCIALDLLEIDELRCSPFPIGHGSIGMEHGLYPNPPPATAHLLIGWPTCAADVAGELVTPTAAAILTTLATPGRPDLVVEKIGYGAGRSDFSIPNVTRVIIGTSVESTRANEHGAPAGDDVVVLEANIDDMSPQHYELAMERLFAAGALDVWLTPITMKKGRPAITLSAMAAPPDEDAVARAMLTETTTIGVRVRTERRHVLPRAAATVQTPYGTVRVKRAGTNGETRTRAEYDDLLRIARERNLPLPEVARVVDASIQGEVST